jgi:anti-sigma regulatory factor (Ser/Thr protein kinase)
MTRSDLASGGTGVIREPVQVRPVATGATSSISIEADARSVKLVRDFMADVYGGILGETALYLAQTVAGELATNAVRHGGTDRVVVRTYESAEGPVVEVVDRGSRMPELRGPSEDATSGRGLWIVEMLAERWGCTPPAADAEKIVWAVVKTSSER